MYSAFALYIAATLFSPLCTALAPPGPWDEFNYAPSSRSVRPAYVHEINGTVTDAQSLVQNSTNASATLSGNGSYVVLDFGQEVGGLISLDVVNATTSSAFSLSFTESPLFISPTESDDSSRTLSTENSDGVESVAAPLSLGTFTQPPGLLRGGFRYLTIVSNADDALSIANVVLNITFEPFAGDALRDYTGYFYAKDNNFHDSDFITKIWYGGAYTVQTNVIDVNTGRQNGGLLPGWANNATGGPVTGPILVDGAKRDRNVWPGDMGISSHTRQVSVNDLLPVQNSVRVMFSTQNVTTGAFNYSGPPINGQGSDTYISWSLIGLYNYYLYSGDLSTVQDLWANYTKAVAFLEAQVDDTGLMNVTAAWSNDWGRVGGTGHNSAANALLYQTLTTAADLATHLGDTSLAEAYAANATIVKTAYNSMLWDAAAGMYRDNETTTMYPEDGNSLAVVYNLTQTPEQNQQISVGLTNYWTDIGPLCPELADTIIPFIGGLELQAHFIAGNGSRALDLLRREWGYILYTNISVHSTFLEGFTANGSLGYRAAAGYDYDYSYTSHSHGWSTGPTPALSFYVVGLQVTSPQGATWRVAPVLSGLDAAEGGYETSLGWFGVKWSVDNGTLTVLVTTPEGTNGTVVLPGSGNVTLDGKESGSGPVSVSGGNHTLVQKV
ncbi:glycoside hydrolase family 78 protein [Serpula lacrymans var. lacrymans S7.3]|uniref:Glycoside hydrolase family 78 protein n=2 Tax=Serpula lacrymans var. lacrymans TaxID=341189 RepID=F8PF96_SERL3|nr:glycoside hydrolase family 78 protein [Serpula lacrymans var. lacrymans S7.9]EGO04202.1 glycoside hydrolase family 78 protein [Serpula lacrymans var. lacrymans S7.3]EGO30143.1 glycoside hydrolase family 78 protein [Serpula lacrymans var. lacrymans S7.9]